MGGGDLNMKKSWHPLLLKNQERVWLEEKKALEEKKKLDQLRKEKEEERQLQELQRLQEEQTGKKRTEKLEWMYTTPATGTSQNPNDLEDYLLGKKRVDKILTADDNAKLGATHKNFIAVQNANTARDVAAKIREDPLFAIKQQEQAAYQALMSNPLRLREMQQRNGIKPKKSKKDKEEKKRLKEERRKQKAARSRSLSPSHPTRRSPSPYQSRSRSPPPSRSRYDDHDGHRYRRDHSRTRTRSRSPSLEPYRRPARVWPRSDDSDDNTYERRRSRSRSLERNGKRPRTRSPGYDRSSEKRSRVSLPPPPPPPRDNTTDDRAARLAAMSSNASTLSVQRQERLKSLLEKEKADLEAEERARAKSKGFGSFLSAEQKKVFGGVGGLEDRLRSGRNALVRNID